MKWLLYFFAVMMIVGCGSRYQYSIYEATDLQKLGTPKTFSFDDSYQLYLRKTFKKDHIISRDSINPEDALIEKVFLLISPKTKVAVYITFRPDKYQSFYAEQKEPDSVINLFNLRSIQFGVFNKAKLSVTFKDKSRRSGINEDSWSLKDEGHRIVLSSIDETRKGIYAKTFKMDEAFGREVNFTKISGFSFIYKEPDYAEEPSVEFLKWQKVHLLDGNKLSIYPGVNEIFLTFTNPQDQHQILLGYDSNRLLHDASAYFQTP